MVLAGKQAIDGDSSQVPAMLAEVLGWPSVCQVTQLKLHPVRKAWRQAGGGKREIVELPTPCVVTCDKGLNTPRYPTLPGIMMAKRKPIEVLDAAALGLDPSTVGAAASVVSQVGWGAPPAAQPDGSSKGTLPLWCPSSSHCFVTKPKSCRRFESWETVFW